MPDNNTNTEEKILESARHIFTQKGMDGARMQEIANHAGINKALLHYYYRTKEKLFKAVFHQVFKILIQKIDTILNADIPLFEKIDSFIDNYIDSLRKHKFIPMFVLNELSKNPERLSELFKTIKPEPSLFNNQVNEAIKNGEINPISPQHLITNIIALCIFPIIATPILQMVLFEGNMSNYEQFMEERKETVKTFIKDSIRIKH